MPTERKSTNSTSTKSRTSLHTSPFVKKTNISSGATKTSGAKSGVRLSASPVRIRQQPAKGKRTGRTQQYGTKRNVTNHTESSKKSVDVKNNRKNTDNSKEVEFVSVLDYITPFLLIVAATYVFICFITQGTKENVGSVGLFVKNLFFGLFSSAAWLIPFMTINIAFFYNRDLKQGCKSNKYRITFSLLCIVLISSAKHLFTKEKALLSLRELYGSGIESAGGGVIGGYVGHILMIFGNVGAGIITISLLVVFVPFLIGYTPAEFFRKITEMIKNFEKSGYVREVVIEDATKKNRKKVTMHKYRVVSDVDLIGQKPFLHKKAKFNIDIPVAGDRNFADTQEVGTDDTYYTDDRNKTNSNTDNKDISLDSQVSTSLPEKDKMSWENKAVQKTETAKIKKADAVLLPEEDNSSQIFNTNESCVPVIVESSPVKRNDEPEMLTSENSSDTLNIQKSRLFGDVAGGTEYKFPPFAFLTKDMSNNNIDISEELKVISQKLIETLASFNVKAQIAEVSRGPAITRYEISPDTGVKVRSIVNLVDDISLNLATGGVRIEAPIPGKAAVGVEVPNKIVSVVHLRSLLEEQKFIRAKSSTTVALGMDVAGNPIYSDISKMPHLLIAGATGMGKSVCINSIITSILYKAKPTEVKLILIDPKKVELSIYNGIPHLLVPVVSEPKKAAGSLSWAVNEMENRFVLMEEKGVRDLNSYNEEVRDEPDTEPLPQIIIVIDELADLMMTAPADVEVSIARLTQKARAAGIHVIIGTQRPSVDVITGLIKSNIPSRIAFTVASQIDSRTIIDIAGAEKLIGRGDMLYLPAGAAKPIRVQGTFINEKDVIKVVNFVKKQFTGIYNEKVIDDINSEAQKCNTKGAKIIEKNND